MLQFNDFKVFYLFCESGIIGRLLQVRLVEINLFNVVNVIKFIKSLSLSRLLLGIQVTVQKY